MKNFIKNSPYFSFSIFENIDIQNIENQLNKENFAKNIQSVLDVEFSDVFPKYLVAQHKGGATKSKFLAFTPLHHQNKVVMVSNQEDGMIQFCRHLSKKLGVICYNIALCDNKGEEPMSLFSLIENGKDKRVVYAMKDPRWIFYQEGNPLPFENLDYYQNRYIKNRLNQAILLEYLEKLGFCILENDFWRSEKALFVEF